MKHVNKVGPKVLHGIQKPIHLPASKLADLVADGNMVVDTRSTGEYAASHFPGTINIPLDQLSIWAGWFVDYEKPLYLLVDGENARQAVRDLVYIGIDTVQGYFEPSALGVLSEMGHQMGSYQVATPSELADKVLNGEVTLVDVRGKTAWDEGRLPNAQHLALGYLLNRADEVMDSKPIVVQCRTGNRSAIGSAILKAKGAKEVINMMGGYRDWATAGLPIES
jgi:hydroxyacylglutathione hydrolase